MKVNACAAALLLALAAAPVAAAPKVVTDIPPVHALAAMAMEGVGTPELLLPPGASPHHLSLRPTEAARLEGAQVVFWIGERLSPWMEDAVQALAPMARSVELIEAEGVHVMPLREGARFEAHRHDDDEDEHAHDHDAAHEHEHEHDHDPGHGHGHAGGDPHVWLDPENAAAMLTAIAAALSEADPENAARYAVNAGAGRATLKALEAEIAARMAPEKGKPFIVFHDAYHYFEARFGVEAAGAVSLSDASAPGPARLEEVRDVVKETGALCVFAEPQFDPKLAALVAEGTDARPAVIDPLGRDLEPGAGLYAALLRQVASSLADCLGAR